MTRTAQNALSVINRVSCKIQTQLSVHDKERLAMKDALAKFRVYLLRDRPFIFDTDHESLRTAVNSPHLSQRMARWFSFFAEFSFSVEYKPGRLNVMADVLSRRPDLKPTDASSSVAEHTVRTLSCSVPSSSLLDDVRNAYARDKDIVHLMGYLANPSRQVLKRLSVQYRSSTDRYSVENGLLYYKAVADDAPRVFVPG